MPALHGELLTGTLSAATTVGGLTLVSDGFAALPVVASPNTMLLALDPSGTAGRPELVTVQAHSAGSTSVTVQRGSQGSTARAHASGVRWVHGLSASEFDALDADTATRLLKTGGTLTGALVVPSTPTDGLHAASKAYVDTTTATYPQWDTWNPVLTLQPTITSLLSTATAPRTVQYARWIRHGRRVTVSFRLTITGYPVSGAGVGAGTAVDPSLQSGLPSDALRITLPVQAASGVDIMHGHVALRQISYNNSGFDIGLHLMAVMVGTSYFYVAGNGTSSGRYGNGTGFGIPVLAGRTSNSVKNDILAGTFTYEAAT